ncbi:hypothetical protein Glove_557g48 [Diversispora epigaea]|uniref:Protein kinase domain-containing protein n=1 Tax=Diversispora epigaea TaxID=1348612 RepID=A0A397GAV4_9GLOM|nr:hypothetical protein Glove_557g48 [Diversispora epigaea]
MIDIKLSENFPTLFKKKGKIFVLKKFGGISVLLIGDPYQLPPVNIDKISSVEKFFPLFLTTCHCQQTESTFYQEKRRIGILDPQTKLIFKSDETDKIFYHYTNYLTEVAFVIFLNNSLVSLDESIFADGQTNEMSIKADAKMAILLRTSGKMIAINLYGITKGPNTHKNMMVLHYFEGLAGKFSEIHELNIVHRDFHPGNILKYSLESNYTL